MYAICMVFEGGLADHWPDAVMAAFLAFAVWLLQRWISSGDRRDEALAAEARKQGDKIVDHEVRITVIEKNSPRDRFRT